MSYKIIGRSQILNNIDYDPFDSDDNIIQDSKYFQLRLADTPYDYVLEHYVLWEKQSWYNADKLIEEKEIKDYWINKGFTVVENNFVDKSVKGIYHIHLVKFIRYDEIW
jgi:hypothetical protein